MNERISYLTSEGLTKLRSELDFLVRVRRKEIASRIQEAKELGDLSENAEYQEAKNEQAFNEGRIEELDVILKHAVLIEGGNGHHDAVMVGSNITVEIAGQKKELHLVGSNEADPVNGRISNESPLGQALIGKRVNDLVEIDTPKGRVSYSIANIS